MIIHRNLFSCYGIPSWCYGLNKIHKGGILLRYINININSPSAELGKFLLPSLQILYHYNSFDINNPFYLQEQFKSLNIPYNFF